MIVASIWLLCSIVNFSRCVPFRIPLLPASSCLRCIGVPETKTSALQLPEEGGAEGLVLRANGLTRNLERYKTRNPTTIPSLLDPSSHPSSTCHQAREPGIPTTEGPKGLWELRALYRDMENHKNNMEPKMGSRFGWGVGLIA